MATPAKQHRRSTRAKTFYASFSLPLRLRAAVSPSSPFAPRTPHSTLKHLLDLGRQDLLGQRPDMLIVDLAAAVYEKGLGHAIGPVVDRHPSLWIRTVREPQREPLA